MTTLRANQDQDYLQALVFSLQENMKARILARFKELFARFSAPENYYLIFREQGLKLLVSDFYRIMEQDPYAKDCLALHQLENGKVLASSQEKLFCFLSGWLGGPQLFIQKYGAPKMRARHLRFDIGVKEKEQWLYCMSKALESHPNKKLNKKAKQELLRSFTALGMRIQNRPQ